MKFPSYRARRLRNEKALRYLVRETHLSADQLIMPYFVEEGLVGKKEISAMPGQFRFSIDALMSELKNLQKSGIRHILLFGIPKKKSELAKSAYDSSGIVQKTIRRIKKEFPSLTIISDVCLCEYMSHGHCGIVKKGKIENDPTLALLAKTAVSHAKAGADIVAPSDMMDGRVQAIRSALDKSGFQMTPILSYAAKYASSFYGPFREAAGSAPKFGDRKSYQMDPANRDEALREIEADIKEGADLIMVKPALSYLDVIAAAKAKFHIPLVAYQVSGEYAMIKLAARAGFMNERALVLESLLSIRRAGATSIITYFAKEAALWLRQEKDLFI